MKIEDLDDPQIRAAIEDLIAREIAARWYVTTPARVWGVAVHDEAVAKFREISKAVVRLVEDYRPGDEVKTDEEFSKRARPAVPQRRGSDSPPPGLW